MNAIYREEDAQGSRYSVVRAHLLRIDVGKRLQPGEGSGWLCPSPSQSIMPTTEHDMRLRLACDAVLRDGSRQGSWARPRASHRERSAGAPARCTRCLIRMLIML